MLGKKPLPLLIRGTNFQIKVWEALLRIPFGRSGRPIRTSPEAIGNPKAVRAVGSAVGKNNISWLIPCHRVILSSGVMHNYRWGVRQKKDPERPRSWHGQCRRGLTRRPIRRSAPVERRPASPRRGAGAVASVIAGSKRRSTCQASVTASIEP